LRRIRLTLELQPSDEAKLAGARDQEAAGPLGDDEPTERPLDEPDVTAEQGGR